MTKATILAGVGEGRMFQLGNQMTNYLIDTSILGICSSVLLYAGMFLLMPRVLSNPIFRFIFSVMNGGIVLFTGFVWARIMNNCHLRTTDMSVLMLIGPWLLPVMIVSVLGIYNLIKISTIGKIE